MNRARGSKFLVNDEKHPNKYFKLSLAAPSMLSALLSRKSILGQSTPVSVRDGALLH